MDQVNAFEKYLLSFFKKEWEFVDYPLKTWKNPNARQANIQYGAGIVNWPLLVGHGETTGEAIKQLRDRFHLQKVSYKSPRPGTKVPIRYSSTTNLDRNKDLARDFLRKIFNLDYDRGFYSDGSILEYFIANSEDLSKSKGDVIKRIQSFYDIDITAIWDQPLWEVLEYIKHKINA